MAGSRHRVPWDGPLPLLAGTNRAFAAVTAASSPGGPTPHVRHSPDTVVPSCTGEVFDADGIRAELRRRDHEFRERGDTEVVLRAYEEWGPSCAERLRGMIALPVGTCGARNSC